MEPINSPLVGRLHGSPDRYAELLALFDARDRADAERSEQWALAEARHNDRLRTAGQRLADELKQLRKVGNTDQIDALLNAWRHALSR